MTSANMLYNNLIVQAARYGMHNIEVTKHLIESCPKGFEITSGINDAFLVTAECGQEELASLLIQKGAFINYQRPQDRASAIIIAAMNNQHKFIDFLALRKADLNLQDNFGNTALGTSCNMGFVDTIKKLLQYGANLNIANFRHETPLMNLINPNKNYEDMDIRSQIGTMIRDMINRGAEVEPKNADGMTFLEIIFAYNRLNYIEPVKDILSISSNHKNELLDKYPSYSEIINSIHTITSEHAATPWSLSVEDVADISVSISGGRSDAEEI